MDADGNFVIAWESYHEHNINGTYSNIYAQKFYSNGIPRAGEFRVNTYLTKEQQFASVAMAVDGAFVISWQSNGQDGSGYGVYAQRYNKSGDPEGSEFRVNVATTGNQGDPSAAMDAYGNFVIVWESENQDGSG